MPCFLRFALSLLCLLFLEHPLASAQSYRYLDESGNIFFADSIDQIPRKYRSQVLRPTPAPQFDPKALKQKQRAEARKKREKEKEKKKRELARRRYETQQQIKKRSKYAKNLGSGKGDEEEPDTEERVHAEKPNTEPQQAEDDNSQDPE